MSTRRARSSPSRVREGNRGPTDGFGDFEFEGLPNAASYKVTVTADGYASRQLDVQTYASVFLGDIVLERTPV